MAEEIQKPQPAPTTTGAIVKKGPKATLKDLLEGPEFKGAIKQALAGVKVSPESFVRAALTAATRNPQLYKVSPNSLFQCLFDVAQMGLYPDGRRAHLIPFWSNEHKEVQCQLIVDYKGIAELARKNGDVVYIHADIVREGEHYVCRYGTDGRLEHIPDSNCEDNPIRCAYSHVKFLIPGTTMLVEEYTQMSIKAIEKIRQRSKSKDKGPWVTDFEEMCKKTVFRRHSKTLALSPETRAAVEYGEEAEFEHLKAAIPAVVPKVTPYVEIEEDLIEEEPKKASKRVRTPKQAVMTPEEADIAPKPDSRSIPPAIHPEMDDSLFADTDPETKTDAQRLGELIRTNGIDRNSFFEYLNEVGLSHVKDPKLKILTYVDMKPADLAATVQNWEANLHDYENWLWKKDSAA